MFLSKSDLVESYIHVRTHARTHGHFISINRAIFSNCSNGAVIQVNRFTRVQNLPTAYLHHLALPSVKTKTCQHNYSQTII